MNECIMPGGINIRPMCEQDLPQVLEIDQLSFSMPWPEHSYRYELFENKTSLCYVAEQIFPGSHRVIGMAVVWLVEDEAHIATIAVHPDFRGQGIGKCLMAEVLRCSVQRGARLATLEVRAGNVVAQRMYRIFGLEVVSSRPRYYHDNQEDALIMTVSNLDKRYLQWLDNQFVTPD